MTTILLIRHGENNMVGKRLAGRLPDVHLNERGKKQAQQVAAGAVQGADQGNLQQPAGARCGDGRAAGPGAWAADPNGARG